MINLILKKIKIFRLKGKIKKLEILYEKDSSNLSLRKELITHIVELIKLYNS